MLPQYTLNTVFWTNEDLIVADDQLRYAKIHFLYSSIRPQHGNTVYQENVDQANYTLYYGNGPHEHNDV
jgi:hypothetical protein